MTDVKHCPECKADLPADAPEGLCSKCMLLHGIATLPSTPVPPSTAGPNPSAFSGLFTPPSPKDLASRFSQLEVLELLGQGGMGAVYKARQPGLDRLVALKILPPEAGRDPAFAERFTREARALARLNHPNIITVFDFGQSGDLYYFLMEFVDGVNLRQMIRTAYLKPDQALRIVPQVCDALQFAHEEGFVHRDIKPENILLDKKGRVKVADFGIAKLLGHKTGDYTLTGPWQVMGTMHYMAPEQMDNPLGVDHRADIYSLGVVFYEMLTGQLPRGRFAPPSQKTGVDVRLDQVVLRALENEPERRYQHASEIKTDVEAITRETIQPALSSAATASFDAPVMTDADERIRRKVLFPAIGLLIASLFSLLAAIGIPFMWLVNETDRNGMGWLIGLTAMAVSSGIGAITLLGVIEMTRLGNLYVATAASIVAMLPSSGCFLGMPMGLWAFVVLRNPEVIAAFQRKKGQQARSPVAVTPWPKPLTAPTLNRLTPLQSRPQAAPIATVLPAGTPRTGTPAAATRSEPTADQALAEFHATKIELARGRVRSPAILLMIAGVLNLLNVFRSGSGFFGWSALLGPLIIFGAWKMWKLRSRPFALVTGVLAIASVPAHSLGFLSLIAGIWCLMTLNRLDVKEAFRLREQMV
jgi:tRNA A-37 threonylcarbamoyl transferase component Bud32